MTPQEVAQVTYVERSIWLEDKGHALPPTRRFTARKIAQYAAIAYRAAKAEFDDPKPKLRSCGVCHELLVCNIDAHRRVGWHV